MGSSTSGNYRHKGRIGQVGGSLPKLGGIMEKLFKTYKAETTFADKDTGEVNIFIPLSTNSIDRDGEVIEPEAFKKVLPKFRKHPVLIASHNYSDLENQIGEWNNLRITETGLEGKPKYYINMGNSQADWAFKLASMGKAAYSVGFIPDPEGIEEGDGKKKPKRTYKNLHDLLEISQCIIPSNREAIQTIRAKSVESKDEIVTQLCDEVEKDLTTEQPIVQPEIITKPEETEDFIRIPVRECTVTATIPISESQGIEALYCGKEKKVRTYLFKKSKGWTMEKAKAWVEKNDQKSLEDLLSLGIETEEINEPKQVSQAEIGDEIDYLDEIITKEGLNESNKSSLQALANKYLEVIKDKPIKELKEDATQSATNSVETKIDNKGSVIPESELNKKIEPTQEEILSEIKNTKL